MQGRRAKYYLAGLVSLVTLLVYLSTLRNDFIMSWDDDLYILENPFIKSWNPALFKHAFLDFYAANWHPLTWLTHALDYAVWGPNPRGHHLTNTILHAANTFLVVVLAIRLTEAWRSSANNLPSAFPDGRAALIAGGVTGLLFGLHPLHVESVAWAAERKDLLCALFFLLSILTYLSYRSCRTNRTYFLTLFFFILALLSKPMAVTLPAVLLILDWYPFQRIQSVKSFLAAFAEKLPFIALSLASSILTLMAQKAGFAIRSLEVIPLSSRVLVAAQSMILYLWKMIWPLDLIPYYPYPKNVSPLSPEYLSALVVVILITVVCVVAAKKHRWPMSVWGYYAVTLLPVIGIVQVGEQAMADRYTYIPSLGPFFVMGLGAAWMLTMAPAARKGGAFAGLAAGSAIVLAVVALAWLTIRQISVWKDGFTLWTYVIERQPGVSHAYNNRGNAFINSGQIDRAIADYNEAIALHPRYSEAYYNRGVAYGKSGLYSESIDSFNRCLEIDPNKVDAYINRGVSFTQIGRYDNALADFNTALRFNRDHDMAYLGRGKLYYKTGNTGLAGPDFQKACDLGNESGCKAARALAVR